MLKTRSLLARLERFAVACSGGRSLRPAGFTPARACRSECAAGGRHGALETALVALVLAGCAATEQVETATPAPTHVSGVIACRDRAVLPSNAVVEVTLIDMTSATTVGTQTIEQPERLPVPFRIDFAPTTIDPGHAYSVEARIRVGDRLEWLSTSTYLAITHGRPTELEVMMDSVRGVDPAEVWNGVADTPWLLERMDGLPIIAGSRITLTLERGGRLAGKAINDYSSSYERLGDSGLTIAQIASTRMFLDQPPGAMDQEARYFQLLRMVDGYRLDAGRLALMLDGSVVLELVPDAGS